MTDLIARAQSGDSLAFEQLVDPYRRQLQVHCYRMLGSLQDAEDALQETLLAAWQAFGEFEGRASVRTWLYKIATNRCLNALRAAGRRPQVSAADRPETWPEVPEPSHIGEVMWLQPYPDHLLEDVADAAPGPEARIEAREAISLGFVTALQLLSPQQRTVLVLRDVLGFRASEVATMLDTTEESVTSALKRARRGLSERRAEAQEAPAAPGSPEERELIDRLTVAWESNDMDTILAALTDDVWLTMPPMNLEYQGRELATRFFRAVVFRPGHPGFKVVETRANGQPALGFYFVDPVTGLAHAAGILVLTLAGNRVSAITRFDTAVMDRFGLPRTISH